MEDIFIRYNLSKKAILNFAVRQTANIRLIWMDRLDLSRIKLRIAFDYLAKEVSAKRHTGCILNPPVSQRNLCIRFRNKARRREAFACWAFGTIDNVNWQRRYSVSKNTHRAVNSRNLQRGLFGNGNSRHRPS